MAQWPDITFAKATAFNKELKKRINDYFRNNNLNERDNVWMYAKIALILAWYGIIYYLLVFVADSIPEGILYSACFAIGLVAVGFNIQHDANHSAISKYPLLNSFFGLTLDFLCGVNSSKWHISHVNLHHTYTNIVGADEDINAGILGRFAPTQPIRPIHKYQHLYIWALYGFMVMRWQFFSDFFPLFQGKERMKKLNLYSIKSLCVLFMGKLSFYTLALGIPMIYHPWWIVVLFYFGVFYISGIIISIVFQIAHCVEQAEHPPIRIKEGRKMAEHEWVEHQLRTTVDFAHKNWFATFYLGGLNHQVEHHLRPRICHIHYPKLARIVRETCAHFEIPYKVNPTFWSAIKSHYNFLKKMGNPHLINT